MNQQNSFKEVQYWATYHMVVSGNLYRLIDNSTIISYSIQNIFKINDCALIFELIRLFFHLKTGIYDLMAYFSNDTFSN